MLCVELFAKGEKQITELSRYAKGYLVFYVIAGCFLGIGTIVVHLLGFVIGIATGVCFGRLLRRK
jgi:membrane associated rhomboid family serine protease